MTVPKSDYDAIILALQIGDIDTLNDIAEIVDTFPDGVDDFIGRQWIVNAIDIGSISAIRWMLDQHVALTFPNPDGFTVLQCCIDRINPDRHEVLALLIEAGADLNERGFNDWTPLHEAAIRDEFAIIRMLIDAGADATVRTKIDDCTTPEEEARLLGHTNSADLIRDYVADKQDQATP